MARRIIDDKASNPTSLTGQFKLCISLRQPKLSLLAVGGIDADADYPLRMPVTIIRNERAYLDPSNLAARTNNTIFRATFASPFAEGVAPGKLYLFDVLGMYGGQIFTAWELDRPLYKTVNRCIVISNLHDFGFNIIGEAANVSSPARQSKHYVAFHQSLLGTIALCDVTYDRRCADDRATPVSHWRD